MKSIRRLLLASLLLTPFFFPVGAGAADLVLSRVDVAVGLAPLPIPVPIFLPEVRHRQPETVYSRDGHDRHDRDRYYREDRHHHDRRHRDDHRQGWDRHDRGNHRGHDQRQVVIIDRRDCNSRPATVVITDRRR